MSHSQSGSSSSADDGDDDYDIIGVQQSLHRTAPARRAHSLSVHEQLELRQLVEEADDCLSIRHIVDMLSTLILTLIAQLRSSASVPVLARAYRGIIALLVLCESELDVLVDLEIDICALRPEHCPPTSNLPLPKSHHI